MTPRANFRDLPAPDSNAGSCSRNHQRNRQSFRSFRGALYRHFDHKEDVFLAVFEKQVAWLASFLSKQKAGEGTIEDNLRQIA